MSPSAQKRVKPKCGLWEQSSLDTLHGGREGSRAPEKKSAVPRTHRDWRVSHIVNGSQITH